MNLINKITLISLGLILMMDASVVAPILPKIAESYPDVSPQSLKLIITLPVIFIVLFNPVSGKLIKYINRKNVVLMGLALFTIGGISGAFVNNFIVLLVFRSLMGVGLGLISPQCLGTVQALTEGEERVKLTGFVTGLNNLGIILANITAGAVAVIAWRASFFIYGIGAVLFVMTLLFFPKTEIVKASGEQKKRAIGGKMLIYMGVAVMVSVIFNTFLLNFSTFMSKSNLGDTAKIGAMMSLVTMTSFICGFTFKYLAGFFKEKISVASAGSLCIGFSLLSLTNNLVIIGVALVFVGLGIGMAYPILFTSIGKVFPKEDVPFAIAMATSTLYIGRFVCPLVVDNLGVLLQANPLKFPFYFSAVVAAMGAIGFLSRKNRAKEVA